MAATTASRHSGRKSKWDEHRDELRRLHMANWTARAVAAHFRVSRNTIVGVWNRMGLRSTGKPGPEPMSSEEREESRQRRLQQRAGRAREKRAADRARSASDPSPRITQGVVLSALFSSPVPTPMSSETPSSAVVPILVRDAKGKLIANEALKHSTCRWWVGEPDDPKAGFCPHTKVVGLPYCEMHARRAFQPPAVRRTRAPRAPKPDRIPTFADAEVE